MSECNGDGFCLRQADVNEYELNDCPYQCKPLECPNFKVCGSINPKAILQSHNGTCFNCKLMFGKLTFHDSVECPVCLDTKPGVKQSNCDHLVCIECFKRCQYGEKISQPVFPYSQEVEDEYDNNPGDPKWINDPLIVKYIEDWIAHENILETNYYKNTSLRLCGICRK